MEEQIRILCVDDEMNVLKALERAFLDEGYALLTALAGNDGLAILEKSAPVQIVISDYRMPGMNGVDFLSQVSERWPDTVRIVLSGYADTTSVIAAINEGQIYKFISKPWNDDELRVTIVNAIDRYILNRKNIELTQQLKKANKELERVNYVLGRLAAQKSSRVMFENKILSRAHRILDNLPAAVLAFDPDGSVIHCNRKGGDLFGITMEYVLLEKGRGDLLPGELNTFIDRLLTEGECCGLLRINGEVFRARGSVAGDRDLGGIILMCEDAG